MQSTPSCQFQSIIQTHVSDDLIQRLIYHAQTQPEAPALYTSTMTFSYQMLLHAVVAYQANLHKRQARLVLCCLHRTPEMLITLLALQWLQIPYIPLDPETPEGRLIDIAQASNASLLLLNTTHVLSDFPIPLERITWSTAPQTDPYHLPEKPLDHTIAYIIYTSGSTGTPKGVTIARNALNHVLNCMSVYFMNEPDAIMLASTTLAFDIAQLELFLPLWQGRALWLADDLTHRDPFALKHLLETYPITFFQSTPSLWRALLASGWAPSTKKLTALCGGEALSPALAAQLQPYVQSLWNLYGPTEATIWCALKKIIPNTPITVGRPIANVAFFVLDENLNPRPPGEKGELYISGPTLAMCYLNQPHLTDERFISAPFYPHVRLYRVGDIASQNDEGDWIIWGRSDSQIKLHGYRIELEEIEHHLYLDPSIQDAAVLVHEEQLIAYITVDQNFSHPKLLTSLSYHLPTYMHPARYMILEAMPLSVNGKIDRRALPRPIESNHTYTAPITPLEKRLCTYWAAAFQKKEISTTASFLALGGHSLIAIDILTRIKASEHQTLSLETFYACENIQGLATRLSTDPLHSSFPQHHAQRSETLNDYQKTLWLSKHTEPQLRVFNLVSRRRVKGILNAQRYQQALEQLYQDTPYLYQRLGKFKPEYYSVSSRPILNIQDIRNQPNANNIVAQHYSDLFYQHRWPKKSLSLICTLFYLPDECSEIQLCVDHLLFDDISMHALWTRLEQYYLQEKPSSMVHTHATNVDHTQTIHALFWENYFQDARLLPIESCHQSINRHSPQSAISSIILPEILLSSLQCIAAEKGLPFHTLCYAAIVQALQDATPITRPPMLVINTVQSTRNNLESLGCFLALHSFKVPFSTKIPTLDLALNIHATQTYTRPYQNTPNLIKYAAIPHQRRMGHRILKALTTWVLSSYQHGFNTHHFQTEEIEACAKMAGYRQHHQCFVNLNILPDFFKLSQDPSYCGYPSLYLKQDSYPVMPLSTGIDIWFYRDGPDHKAHMLIAGPIHETFRMHVLNSFLKHLHDFTRDHIFQKIPHNVL